MSTSQLQHILDTKQAPIITISQIEDALKPFTELVKDIDECLSDDGVFYDASFFKYEILIENASGVKTPSGYFASRFDFLIGDSIKITLEPKLVASFVFQSQLALSCRFLGRELTYIKGEKDWYYKKPLDAFYNSLDSYKVERVSKEFILESLRDGVASYKPIVIVKS